MLVRSRPRTCASNLQCSKFFTRFRDLATASPTKEKPNDTPGVQSTQVLEQHLDRSTSNQVKNNGAWNDENEALETTEAAWPASVSSLQDGEAICVENTAVLMGNISEGILGPNESESHVLAWKRQTESGPEMPSTPPESICGDPPAANKWIGLAQRLHDESFSQNMLDRDGSFPDHFRATSQPERVITSGKDTVSNSPLYPTPESFKEVADPLSFKVGTRQGRLTETEQQRRSCYRCFINKERCVLDARSTQDATCSPCREKPNTARTWSLPCSSVGLDQRAYFLFPNIVQSQLQGANVDAYINSQVGALVPNSSIKLSLTIGFGLPLVLDAVEFVPGHQRAPEIIYSRPRKTNRWKMLKLESPPLLPLLLDRKLFERQFDVWLD